MGLFNWKKSEEELVEKTKRSRRAPVTRDFTDSLQCNEALTKGLYHNTYPGLKLAGGLAFPPIAVPIYFMGYPVVTEERYQDLVDEIIETKTNDMQQIHIQDHREGTIWIYPKFVKGVLAWEQIPDTIVTDIIRDIDTGKIISIITSEDIKVTTGFNRSVSVKRKRVYEENRVTVTYEGGELPEQLKDRTSRNPAGILPDPFANNTDGDEVRGHSDYERMLPDLKNYHDIELARSQMLAKFKTKMVQDVKNVDDWLGNNGFESIADIDIQTIDMIFNLPEEKTDFIFPSEANQTYKDTLSQIFKKLVEESGVPEITWGLKTTGNNASVEESMGTLLKYVLDKQRQKTEQYKILYDASLRLLGAVDPDVKVTWNELESMSAKEQVAVFELFAKGIASLGSSALITKQQVFNMWKMQYPKQTEETFEEFVSSVQEMAIFKSFKDSAYMDQLDAGGVDRNTDV